MKDRYLQVKSETDDVYTIGGYGVVFGEEDLAGEHFEADTDFWIGKVTEQPMLLYDHGEDEDGPGKGVIGKVTKVLPDDVGLWVEAQIRKGEKYAEAIMELIRKGKLGLSSAAIGHLVDIAADGKILSWPIGELSLTPTPAELRTLGVAELRSLAVLNPAIKSLLPQDGPTVELAVEDGQKVIRLRGI